MPTIQGYIRCDWAGCSNEARYIDSRGDWLCAVHDHGPAPSVRISDIPALISRLAFDEPSNAEELILMKIRPGSPSK